MSPLVPGMRVVCVGGVNRHYTATERALADQYIPHRPAVGDVYTIRELFVAHDRHGRNTGRLALFLVEITNPPYRDHGEPGFLAGYFRPVRTVRKSHTIGEQAGL